MRTDIAKEAKNSFPNLSGIRETIHKSGAFECVRIFVETEAAAKKLDKPIGTYLTITMPKYDTLSASDRTRCARFAAKELNSLLPISGDVLVIGLGNRHITADALGSRTAEAVLTTRHVISLFSDVLPSGTRTVSSFCAGVLGATGLETVEVVSALCEKVRPDAVLVVDSLAAGSPDHIGVMLQMNDSGISPGAGIGNFQTSLNQKTLGVPVVAIGVPLVVGAEAIVKKAVRRGLSEEEQRTLKGLVLTPDSIDLAVKEAAKLLSKCINLALHGRNLSALEKLLP